MTWQVLIAHAKGEEHLAEELGGPLREAGYEVVHEGTVLVGESVVGTAAAALNSGGPIVLCGTERAVGNRWTRKVVEAAQRSRERVRVFCVQMEEEADVELRAFDSKIAHYWQDPAKAIIELLRAVQHHFPLDQAAEEAVRADDIEQRYRTLALETCDIIDLANLPENDRHLAQRRLDLRRLYVALRVRVELELGKDAGDDVLAVLEQRRSGLRRVLAGWDKTQGERPAPDERVPLGERLGVARRLVVLGDPGAGKTTLVRWIATAYLLRLKRDPDWKDLPDVETLPDFDWLPVIVRCRELDQSCLGGGLDDVLRHTLRKSELSDEQATGLVRLLRDKLVRGEALLLLDGLDEITDPAARINFCRQLEQIHVAYPDAPIIATSRVVGYREMGYRIGRGFEHVTVADLAREDKDDFARRWCAVTELPEREARVTEELIRDIHSSDRIERLTGNPMLLTTMALVKRKVGKLPSRRADLYRDAVEVLLNWRREVDQPLDRYEAIPQLEYVAYAMCDRGVQQLREDEIVALFEQMREEYPQVHAVRAHEPREFLRLLERRTGILIEAGHVRHNGWMVPVFEFRHLTFQEYLAGLALVEGRFPGRNRERSLAENVAPLAGRVSEVESQFGLKEMAVTEHWREALRLCVTSCNDDDVDDVILAILTPLPDEDVEMVARPRAILAAQCLADEPNVSEGVAEKALQTFAVQSPNISNAPDIGPLTESALVELGSSRWNQALHSLLLEEFCRQELEDRWNVSLLYARAIQSFVPRKNILFREWLRGQIDKITSDVEKVAINAVFNIIVVSSTGGLHKEPGLIDALLSMLSRTDPVSFAAAVALALLNNKLLKDGGWQPSDAALLQIRLAISDSRADLNMVQVLIEILVRECDQGATAPLLIRLDDQASWMQLVAAVALGKIGSREAIDGLFSKLVAEDIGARIVALTGLAQTCENETDRKLLSKSLDNFQPYLDPQEPISDERVLEAAEKLELPPDDIRRRYEALAQRFGLKLAWQPSG